MGRGNVINTLFCAVILSAISVLGVLGLPGCGGDSGPTPGGLSITSTSLPEGQINQPYSASLSGSGGTLPYTWSVSPALPANLSLDSVTGAISGAPTTQATTTHTFTLHDSSVPAQIVQQTLSLTVIPPPGVLTIITTSLANGSVNQAYSRPVQATGGTAPLTWSIVPGTGTLPPGLNLNQTTGAISGTPTTAGTSSFTVRVQDARGQSAMQALSITITSAPPPPNPPSITTTTLPDGTIGVPYSQPVQVTGGTGALSWSIVGGTGTLPAGLNLNQINGLISGTPTKAGTSTFSVRVQDNAGLTDTQALSITINQPTPPPAPSITTTTLPAGTIGQPYNQTLQASGGTGGLTWSLVPGTGTLPLGLNLNQTTGVISGTPIVPAGTSNFTVQVIDAALQSDTQALSIVINLTNPPIITTTALPGGTVGQPYNQTLQATGGIGILTWSFSGSLPAMLSLSPAGVISGTPTNTGTSNFTVTVKDTLNQSSSQALSIAVSAGLAITTTSLQTGREGRAYNATLQSSGGLQPVSWSVTPALPDGLSLNQTTGEISGTPANGTGGITYHLTFTVQDSTTPTPQTASKQIDLRINNS